MISPSIESRVDTERANKAAAIRFIEAFNHDDWDVVREVVAEGFVYHHPIGGTVEAGPEGMVATWAGFKRLSPDSWHPVPVLIAEGDYAAVLLPTYGRFTGRSDQAPPPTGGRLDYGMVNIVRFEAGKLAEMWFGMDPLVEFQQMGVAPAFPPRPHGPTEQASLAAFLGAAETAPADYDTLTTFGDSVIACAPSQSSPASRNRRLEVYRIVSGDPILLYRHEIATNPPYGGDPTVDTAASRAIVGRWFDDVLRAHRLEALAEIASPNVLVHPTAMPCECGHYGTAGLDAWLQEQWRAFPDLTIIDCSTVASGDIVAARWQARGTARGEFLGIAATGGIVDYSGVSMYRIEDGRIAEIWETRNTLGIMHQLDPRIAGGHRH